MQRRLPRLNALAGPRFGTLGIPATLPPLPCPAGRENKPPSPKTSRQEAADAAPHFTFCSFNFG